MSDLSIHPRHWPAEFCPGEQKSRNCTKPYKSSKGKLGKALARRDARRKNTAPGNRMPGSMKP